MARMMLLSGFEATKATPSRVMQLIDHPRPRNHAWLQQLAQLLNGKAGLFENV